MKNFIIRRNTLLIIASICIGVFLVKIWNQQFHQNNPIPVYHLSDKPSDRSRGFQRNQESPLDLRIHFVDGLDHSASRSPDQIRVLNGQPQITLILINQSDRSLELWRPNCPPGDNAISIQFKNKATDTEFFQSQVRHCYTGGMGIPKTVSLSPGGLLLHPIDFASQWWPFPFEVNPGESTEIFMRVVYQSLRHPEVDLKYTQKADSVWQGRLETPWRKLDVHNLTENVVR